MSEGTNEVRQPSVHTPLTNPGGKMRVTSQLSGRPPPSSPPATPPTHTDKAPLTPVPPQPPSPTLLSDTLLCPSSTSLTNPSFRLLNHYPKHLHSFPL
ncbi:hypothetical protein Pcinc_035577 [Petrolisthes cinctipes]|uniref:Uncharacterized protein n=1 Tax=Petrolisthes cinctipes TaxID=88211 RepID=A0AAE1BWA6_PETCI|nr:hypothetical protein Pcinc_035577 [Petrolisthes cinctipes]